MKISEKLITLLILSAIVLPIFLSTPLPSNAGSSPSVNMSPQTYNVYKFAVCAPTYTWGASTSGTYANTFSANGVWHTSTATLHAGTPTSSTKATASWTDNNTYGTFVWSNPTRAQATDNSYATATDTTTGNTHYLKGVGFGFAIPTSSTINGIVVSIERKKDSAPSVTWTDSVVRLLKANVVIGDNKATSTSYTTSDVTENHGGSSDLWNAGGWTLAQINAATFGVVYSAHANDPLTSGGVVSCDYISITVYYTPQSYAIDYLYQFVFNESAGESVTQIDWGITGIASPAISFYMWNWTSNAWVFQSTITLSYYVQGGTNLDENSFVNATGGVKIRLYEVTANWEYSIAIDWLYIYLTYTLLSVPNVNLIYPDNGAVSSDANVNFTWSGTCNYFDHYQYQIATNENFTENLQQWNVTTTFKYVSGLTFQYYFWRVRLVNDYNDVGAWAIRYLDPITTAFISYYDLDGFGTSFNLVKTFINSTRYTVPYYTKTISSSVVLNFTVTDYFTNILYQANRILNATPFQYFDIQLQLVSVTLKGYDLTICNITSNSLLRTVTFFDSVTILLTPQNYVFNGTAWNGEVSFQVSTTIGIAENRLIQLSESYSTTNFAISYFNMGGEDRSFNRFRTYLNGTRLASPVFTFDNVLYHHANITTTDIFGNVLWSHIYQINTTNTFLDIILPSWTIKIYSQEHALAYIYLNGSTGLQIHEWIYEIDHAMADVFAGNYSLNVWYQNASLPGGGVWSNYTLSISADYAIIISNSQIWDIYSAIPEFGTTITNLQVIVGEQLKNIYNQEYTRDEVLQAISEYQDYLNGLVGDSASNQYDWNLAIIITVAVAAVLTGFIARVKRGEKIDLRPYTAPHSMAERDDHNRRK